MHANKDINEGNYIDFSKKEIVEIVKKRAYEIAKEMPKYRPHMEPRGYLCEEN